MICNALEMRPYVRATEEASELFFTYANLVEGAVATQSRVLRPAQASQHRAHAQGLDKRGGRARGSQEVQHDPRARSSPS